VLEVAAVKAEVQGIIRRLRHELDTWERLTMGLLEDPAEVVVAHEEDPDDGPAAGP
jgi:hypothetical protein